MNPARQLYDALRTILPDLPQHHVRRMRLIIADPDALPTVEIEQYALRDGAPYWDAQNNVVPMRQSTLAVVPQPLVDAARRVVDCGCVQGDRLLAAMRVLSDELAKLPK
jgi:hypothetical protein